MSKPDNLSKRSWSHTLRRLVFISLISAVIATFLLIVTYGSYSDTKQTGMLSSSRVIADEPLELKAINPNPVLPVPEVIEKPDYSIPPITDGLAPVISHIPTSENVVFLGIDDGMNKQSTELQLMKKNKIKASLFLTYDIIKDNPKFFEPAIKQGSLIENHTVSHTLLSGLSYQQQKDEICGGADAMQLLYGRRPILFRPPGGDYDQITRQAAADCGMKALVVWVAKANGGSMQYQVGDGLQKGDVVLMHFRPEFKQDMQAFVDAEKKAGLHTELLEDWLNY